MCPKGMKNMKMKEIAEIAGVSPATVSLVLNNRPGVNEHTRAHVAKLLADYGYSVRNSESTLTKRNILYIRFRGSGHLFFQWMTFMKKFLMVLIQRPRS